LFLFIGLQILCAQEELVQDRILSDFARYSEHPREVAYVHLNKSVFIKGEDLGFKAYILDKDHKRPSRETQNLYCVLADSANRIVKTQMIRIRNGVGQGVFELDSLFHTGSYTFKGYTNWMRNFSEANYFQQSIEVLDPETHSTLPVKSLPSGPDVQILPEGGHAVAGIPTVFGIIIKDAGGYGVPGLEGRITDASGKEITRFQVNRFGIGRFELTPLEGMTYYARFNSFNKEHEILLPPAEPLGVSLRLTDLRDQIGIALNARFKDPSRASAPFFLTVHNGDSLKGIPVFFGEAPEQVKVFPKEDLYKGINVFTLFAPSGKPLLERLCFNEQGLVFHQNFKSDVSRDQDSLTVRLEIGGLKPGKFNTLSVSVLPEGSQANPAHHNLPSYALLQPYVRGYIQDAGYYLQGINPRKRYELDNLLLTQGWSSYDWNTVFNHPPEYRFDFEKGIAYTVEFNSRRSDAFYIFPTVHTPSQLLELNPGQKKFTVENFYPLTGEKLSMAEITADGRSRPSGAFVRFKPSAVPPLKSERAHILPGRLGNLFREVEAPPISFENLKKLQLLDEVVVTEKRRGNRLQRLQNRSSGRIDVFASDDPRRDMWLSTYLSNRGYIVNEGLGSMEIRARNPNSPNNDKPVIYLDGVMLTNFDILWRFRLDIVDYIEVNQTGIGSGIMGGGGVIRIATNPNLRRERLGERTHISYDIPLAFEAKKKFYTPVYSSYDSEFFRAFGTLGWFPDLRTDTSGSLSFKVHPQNLAELELHVEGIVNSDEFVSCRLLIATDTE
ncbi:MAG: hypothetical protein P8Z38_05640, partial [Robiginitalea sp.]